MNFNKQEGNIGESLAVKFLKNKHYKILQTNYSCPLGEIDIVAKDGDTIVFVEVKTRASLKYGYPQEAITPQKMLHIQKSALFYLKQHRLLQCAPVRFDCVAILTLDGTDAEINHIENIF